MRGRSEGFLVMKVLKFGGVDISVQSMYRDIWTLGKRECDRLKDTSPTFSNGQSAASAPKTNLMRYFWAATISSVFHHLTLGGI